MAGLLRRPHLHKTDLRRVRIYNYARTADQRVIKSAATREYELLRSLKHPGILEVTGYTEHELGPALLFQDEPGETRLDFYLRQHAAALTLDTRLDLVRQIADAVRYAHGRRRRRRVRTVHLPRSVAFAFANHVIHIARNLLVGSRGIPHPGVCAVWKHTRPAADQ